MSNNVVTYIYKKYISLKVMKKYSKKVKNAFLIQKLKKRLKRDRGVARGYIGIYTPKISPSKLFMG